MENENEQAFFEKKNTNLISTLLDNVLKPKPIVDNVKEEDKYGNSGDKFIVVGRAVVNGFEGLSNIINAIVDVSILLVVVVVLLNRFFFFIITIIIQKTFF